MFMEKGKIVAKDKYELLLETFEKFNDFLDHEVDRDTKESIKCALDSLEINTPEDFKTAIDLLHEQNSVREKY